MQAVSQKQLSKNPSAKSFAERKRNFEEVQHEFEERLRYYEEVKKKKADDLLYQQQTKYSFNPLINDNSRKMARDGPPPTKAKSPVI
jgi:hypothetical protein